MTTDFFEQFAVDPEIMDKSIKVKSKAVFAVFHSIASIDRCAMNINLREGKVSFHLLCQKKGIKKQYTIFFEEADMLDPLVGNTDPMIKMAIKPKPLLDTLSHFASSGLEEITIHYAKDSLSFKSCFADDGKTSADKMVHTDIRMDVGEFDEYLTDGSPFQQTITLKEFKIIIAYCEQIGHPFIIFSH
eukprot:gene12133-14195_t